MTKFQANQYKYAHQAVLVSIQPKWCALITRGDKTIEIRKTKPKMEPPFKCYIYCSNSPKGWFWMTSPNVRRDGTVIGEFVCSNIEELKSNMLFNAPELYSQSCMTRGEFFSYADKKTVYLWHISRLRVYSTPKLLNEFCVQRAPQSWQYITDSWRVKRVEQSETGV